VAPSWSPSVSSVFVLFVVLHPPTSDPSQIQKKGSYYIFTLSHNNNQATLCVCAVHMTMKVSLLSPLILLLMSFSNHAVFAFVCPSPKLASSSSSSSNIRSSSLGSLHAVVVPFTAEHVKRVGGGVAVIPCGNRHLFDPEAEGMCNDNSLNERLQQGVQYAKPSVGTSTVPPLASSSVEGTLTTTTPPLMQAQHWLEDMGLPQNFAKPTSPVTATVLGRARIISEDAPGDIQHVVLKLPQGMHYVEGQSLSVIPPGVDSTTGKPFKPRLYSIASTRYGDLLDGNTVSLCVRRAEYYDPSSGQVDPQKAGVCSNYLCDVTPGMTVQVAGPIGKTMLLPENSATDIIMVATGTGIAPFRAFLQRLFMEETVARHLFTGKAWLILGVPTTGGLLYPDEIAAMQQNTNYPNQLEVDYAISRERTNAQGGKLYVQDVLSEQASKLLDRLEGGAQIYFCGLKGMMPGILLALQQVATERGLDWNVKLKQLQANHQWHVEVY
jgi:ferredoxin--NADP+ reductase